MRARVWAGLAGVGLLLAGCAHPPPPPPPPPPAQSGTGEGTYDITGESQSCVSPKVVTLTGVAPVYLKLMLANDGGWCALRLANGLKPFDAGLLPVLPLHGVVFIHKVAMFTRIDYTPTAGYVGTDSFLVKLIPGYLPVHVSVTVTAASGAATASSPAP